MDESDHQKVLNSRKIPSFDSANGDIVSGNLTVSIVANILPHTTLVRTYKYIFNLKSAILHGSEACTAR